MEIKCLQKNVFPPDTGSSTCRLRSSSSSSTLSFSPFASCEVSYFIRGGAWWVSTLVCLGSILWLIDFWLRWVFLAALSLSLAAGGRGHSSLQCAGCSLRWLPLLRSMGARPCGSVVVVLGLSFPKACGIFPDQRSGPCPLPWQEGSQLWNHQGNQRGTYLNAIF